MKKAIISIVILLVALAGMGIGFWSSYYHYDETKELLIRTETTKEILKDTVNNIGNLWGDSYYDWL